MEMSDIEKKALESMFVDFILDKIGPNKSREDSYSKTIQEITKLLVSSTEEEQKTLTVQVHAFGSFPSKLYIDDSDIDVTIMFLNKDLSQYDYNYDFLNNVLQKIYQTLEKCKEISNLSLIHADVKIVKCVHLGIPVDISICNFVGLCKLQFMNLLESSIFVKQDRISLFKRTLLLIKIWCSAEGGILGSNIGLMASYALECLVIYLFNEKNHEITTEFEGFCLFFKMMTKIKWESSIISIFGVIPVEDYQSMIKLEDFEEMLADFYLKNKGFICPLRIVELSKAIRKFKDCDRTQVFNSSKRIINLKYINILDPLFYSNNLGKSVNFYNFSKITSVFELFHSSLSNLNIAFATLNYDSGTTALNTPVNYLNSLLKLFSRSMSNMHPELFFQSLTRPKIVVDLANKVDTNTQYIDDVLSCITSTTNTTLTEKQIQDFNIKFKLNKAANFLNEYESDYLNEGDSSSDKRVVAFKINKNGCLFLTKEILEVFIKNVEYNCFKCIKDYSCKFEFESIKTILSK